MHQQLAHDTTHDSCVAKISTVSEAMHVGHRGECEHLRVERGNEGTYGYDRDIQDGDDTEHGPRPPQELRPRPAVTQGPEAGQAGDPQLLFRGREGSGVGAMVGSLSWAALHIHRAHQRIRTSACVG
mmetsp:Transcript_112138/g.317635  ORF Transcript_112138/g.317635 Transcript_112138/m.317635 type:complete len:127 (+) Transcript_112138:706-1086(+)